MYLLQVIENKVTMKLLLCAGVVTLLMVSSLVTAKDESEKSEKKDKENLGTVIGIDLGTTYSW